MSPLYPSCPETRRGCSCSRAAVTAAGGGENVQLLAARSPPSDFATL